MHQRDAVYILVQVLLTKENFFTAILATTNTPSEIGA